MANYPEKSYSVIDLKQALEKQRRTIPYFATKQRLNLELKPTDEDLFIYDWEENAYYFIRYRNRKTIFDKIAVLSDIGVPTVRTETAFGLQTTVTVTHNSGYKPSVIIIDNSGNQFIGSIQHINDNQIVVQFNSPKSGFIITN